MKFNYLSVAEYNGYIMKIRYQLIGKTWLNIILKLASDPFYATRRPYLLTESIWKLLELFLATLVVSNHFYVYWCAVAMQAIKQKEHL